MLKIEGTIHQWGEGRVVIGTKAGKTTVALNPRELALLRQQKPTKLWVCVSTEEVDVSDEEDDTLIEEEEEFSVPDTDETST